MSDPRVEKMNAMLNVVTGAGTVLDLLRANRHDEAVELLAVPGLINRNCLRACVRVYSPALEPALDAAITKADRPTTEGNR